MGDVRNEDMLALFEALAEHLNKSAEYKERGRSELERQLLLAEPLFT